MLSTGRRRGRSLKKYKTGLKYFFSNINEYRVFIRKRDILIIRSK